jgi:hypothetical protein
MNSTDEPTPEQEFQSLLLGVDTSGGRPDGLYDGLLPEDQFVLALRLAAGDTLGVPPDYSPDPTPDPDAPRPPKPDRSQGRRTSSVRDPAAEFGNRIIDAIDRPYPSRWRGI